MKRQKQYRYWIEQESSYSTNDRDGWLTLVWSPNLAIFSANPRESSSRNLSLRRIGDSEIWIIHGYGWTCEAEHYVFDNSIDAFDKFIMLTSKEAIVKGRT